MGWDSNLQLADRPICPGNVGIPWFVNRNLARRVKVWLRNFIKLICELEKRFKWNPPQRGNELDNWYFKGTYYYLYLFTFYKHVDHFICLCTLGWILNECDIDKLSLRVSQ
jgi:hypothetical protein